MVVVINDDRVSDVEAYLPVAKAFGNREICLHICNSVVIDNHYHLQASSAVSFVFCLEGAFTVNCSI